MKKILSVITGFLLFSTALYSQQLPLNESYFINKYSLASAYAGNSENNTLFASYRRDWSGEGSAAPHTIRLSYNNGLKNTHVGLGGKLIMDKIGIFQNFIGMASYSYRLESRYDHIYFGISAGFIQSSIDFSDYYNDPNFNYDPVMTRGDVSSRLKFISDLSMVYKHKSFQTGFALSNVGYGEYSYSEVQSGNKPYANYQVHALYSLRLDDLWQVTPLAIYRGGKNMKSQLEVAVQAKCDDRFWGNVALRGKDIFCVGMGFDASKELVVNYTYNFSTGISFSKFQNHELTVGIRLSAFSPRYKSMRYEDFKSRVGSFLNKK